MTMANLDPRLPGTSTRLSAEPAIIQTAPPSMPESPLTFRSIPPLRYPYIYAMFVLVSSLDIVLTWLVLDQHGGYEINPIAASVIAHWGLPGAIGFKFSLTLFVIVICEVISRQRERTARRLARWSVAVSAFPPVYTTMLVGLHLLGPRVPALLAQ